MRLVAGCLRHTLMWDGASWRRRHRLPFPFRKFLRARRTGCGHSKSRRFDGAAYHDGVHAFAVTALSQVWNIR